MQQNQVMEGLGREWGARRVEGFRKNFRFYLEKNEEPWTSFEERSDLKKEFNSLKSTPPAATLSMDCWCGQGEGGC